MRKIAVTPGPALVPVTTNRATAGVLTADATFHLADTSGWETLRELRRYAVLRRLREARALAPATLPRPQP